MSGPLTKILIKSLKAAKNAAGDLPADEGSRIQRIIDWAAGDIVDESNISNYKFETGKPVTVSGYHGTDADIKSFDSTKAGFNTGAQSAKQGFFTTDNPRAASLYPVYEKDVLDHYAGLDTKNFNSGDIKLKKEALKKYKEKNIYDEFAKQQESAKKLFDSVRVDDSIPDSDYVILDAIYNGSSRQIKDTIGNDWGKGWTAKNWKGKSDGFITDKDAVNMVDSLQSNTAKEAAKKLIKYNKAKDEYGDFTYSYQYSKNKWPQNIEGVEYKGKKESFSPNVMPLYTRFENPLVKDYHGSVYRDESFSSIMNKAKESGHDGVIFVNTKDPLSMNVYSTFDERNIRSRFAEFNPENNDSANLLAGGAALGVGVEQITNEADAMTPREELEQLRAIEKSTNPRDELAMLRELDRNQNAKNDNKQGFAGGAAQAALSGATGGLNDEIQAGIAALIASPFIKDKTLKELYTEARDSFRSDAKQFSEDNPKTDLALQIAGGLATGGVGAAKTGTVKGAAAVGSAYGGLAGAGYSDQERFFSPETAVDAAVGTAVGAAVGAGGQKLSQLASSFIKRLNKPDLKVFDESGKFTDDAIQKLDDAVNNGEVSGGEATALIKQGIDEGAVLTPDQARRFNLFKERGVIPLKANITQKTDDFMNQQSAAKRTGPVAESIAAQDEQLINIAQQGVEKINPASLNLPETNANVFKAVDDIVKQMDDKVTESYQLAKKAAKGGANIKLGNLKESLKSNRGKEGVSGHVISAIKQELKNHGVLKGDKQLTVEEAESIRQSMNSLYDSVTPQGRRLLRELKDSIDMDVADAVGHDVFTEARAAKSKFHKVIEKASRNKFDRSRGSILEDVIYNKIPEEKIVTKLLNGRDDDFIKMKSFLLNDAGQNGKQAWSDIKAQVLRNALDKATGTQAKREGGGAVFNVRLFKTELNRLRNSKKFNELFNDDEVKLIDDIIEIGNLRIPQTNVQQGKGPTELAVSQLRKDILKKIPIIGEKAQELIDAVTNYKTDKDLLKFADKTAEVIK